MATKKMPLDAAIAAFYEYRANVVTKNGSLDRATRDRDRMILDKYLAVNGNIATGNLCVTHSGRYFAAVRDTRSRSLGNDLATLRTFVRFIQNQGWLSRAEDPLFGFISPSLEPRERLYIPRKDFERMYELADHHHPRNRMVVAIGLNNLNRASETGDLRIRHLDRNKGTIATWMPKVKRWNHKPISERLDYESQRWLTWYAERAALQGLGPLQPDWYLIPSRKGYRPMGNDPATGRWTGGDAMGITPDRPAKRLDPVVQKVIVDLGYPIRDALTGESLYEGGHTLRRSAALGMWEWLLEEGHPHPIRIVREMLGHQSDSQTEAYIGKKPYRLELEGWVKGKKLFGTGVATGVTKLEDWRRAKA